MSQEFANLSTDASPQSQDLNLRTRSRRNKSGRGRLTPVPSLAMMGSLSKAKGRSAVGTSTVKQELQPLWIPSTRNDFRLEIDLETCPAPQLPSNLVTRKRLLDKLTVDNFPFTQVVAPAGYGKSTLIAEWLQVEQRKHIWLTLSTKDNHLHLFWKRLIQAINVLLPGAGVSTIQLLTSAMSPTVQGLMSVLCRDLYRAAQSHKSAPVVLVIDNYQLINNPTIHARLLDLINLLPKQLQIVILSRQEVPFEEKRIHAPQLAIDYKDLTFDFAETCEFFRKSISCSSTLANAIEISTYMEGWVSGLHLIAAKLAQQQNEPDESLIQKDRQSLKPELMVETFRSAHPTLQVFMLCTSLLSRFTPELCDSLFAGEIHSMMFGIGTASNSFEASEFRNSREMIQYLEKSGQFITRCNDETEWYSYHPMFAEMLRTELRESSLELERILRDRSQLWYLRQEGHTTRRQNA